VVIGSGPLALGFEVRNKDTAVKLWRIAYQAIVGRARV
jgi:hypothetical protein